MNAKVESSRRRLLSHLAAGDVDGAARAMESHLGAVPGSGRAARRPATAQALANRVWVRDTLRRKDPKFAELLDHMLQLQVA
ncbi:MAG TPA: hypothetical protein VG142_07780 [Trebonia sp.]|nr:hypothetical protein [Trebonia sp.]